MSRILLIDDDEVVHMIFEELLESSDYEFSKASEMEAGLALYRQNPADLVFIDIFLPAKVDGLTAIRSLREDYPNARIIGITSASDKQPLEDAVTAGADFAIRKPFMIDVLRRTVEDTLGKPE